MPRTDVPPPGQGKRARRKAWRDNADQATTIYSLTAEETAGTAAEEGMSHELPFWDDALAPQLQPQSQQPQQHFTEEEAQELVEKAYQDGWQQGMEDGYKLGKDKGYKEYKVQIEAEEAEKAKYQARNNVTGYQDTVDTPGNVTSIYATPQMDSAAPEACTSTRMTHTTTTSPESITTSIKHSHSYSAATRSSVSSISPTHSLQNAQIIEITASAAHNSPTSSNTTQTPHLTTENPSNVISESYVAISTLKPPPTASKATWKKPAA